MGVIFNISAHCTDGKFTVARGLAMLVNLTVKLEARGVGTSLGACVDNGEIRLDMRLTVASRNVELRIDEARQLVAEVFGEVAPDWEYTLTPAF